jgi:intracellular multiplication protein IcmK
MLDTVPDSNPPPTDNENAAFSGMLKQSMPLSPRQIVQLHQMIDQSQRAAVIPATIPPRPESSTLMLNLAPGSTPPAIRLAQGYVSSLVFVDSAGNPWPIASYDIGNPKTTSIQWDGKSNILFVQASTPYGDSDLVIRLTGLATPVTLELVSGQRVVDFRRDIHVPGFGPNSKDVPSGNGLPPSADQVLLNVLDGIAPPGSKPLRVKGDEGMAWLLGDKMYLRTRHTLLSPGWIGRMVSPDGMIAYETQASASVLVSRYGNPVELKIEGF